MTNWQPPFVYLLDSHCEAGDFLHYDPGALVASSEIMGEIRGFFERAGELLPLWFDGDECILLNVTVCVDALDHPKTEWLVGDDGGNVEIKRFAFDHDRLAESSIFKIPETCRGSVLTWERDGAPEREFKAFVEQHGLTGLLFEELWDSEKSDS